MRFTSLDDWLSWQETLHPSEIELGLERVASVFHLLHPKPNFPTVITVAGTNGKGSSVAMLNSIYRAAGYQVGCYTSPHLFKYNERIVINGEAVDDQSLCNVFARIDKAREKTSLTYFEFGTLAALDIFLQHSLDVIILEVGLGGRLDAVNIIDSDVALITAISIDHVQWLGNNIDDIVKEKCGVMRSAKPVVSSGLNAMETIKTCATEQDALLYQIGNAFKIIEAADNQNGTQHGTWNWQSDTQQRVALPKPALFGQHQLANAAGVLMVLELLATDLPVNQAAVREGLISIQLSGRFHILSNEPTIIFDVAHNVDAIEKLSQQLQQTPCQGKTLAVLGMLSDKEIKASLMKVTPIIDEWFLAPLSTSRSESVANLHSTLQSCSKTVSIHCCDDIKQAFQAAKTSADIIDRIIVFGSFYTVAEAMQEAL